MKKIILIVVTFVMGILRVSAYEFRTGLSKIAVDGEVYSVYYLDNRINYMFFLNISHDYNLDFDTYYPVSFADVNINPQIKEIVEYKDIIQKNGVTDYGSLITLKLWQRLYPGKMINLYNPRSYEAQSLVIVTDILNEFLNGPDFTQKVYDIKESEELNITSKYFKYLKVTNKDNLEEASISEENLIIKGSPGIYQVELKFINEDGNEPYLLTDGNNILLVDSKSSNKVFYVRVEIGLKNVTLHLENELKEPLKGKKMDIYQNGKLYKTVLSDNLGDIILKLAPGNYEVKENSGDYKKDFIVSDDMNLSLKINTKQSVEINTKPNIPGSNITVPIITIPSGEQPKKEEIISPPEEKIESKKEEIKPVLPEKEIIKKEDDQKINLIFPDTLWV